MKVSLNWVKDYVKLPDDMDLKRLSYDLTMSTVEVEDATDLSESFRNMVIGVVQQCSSTPMPTSSGFAKRTSAAR